jgi:hypothetical protein
MSLQIINAPLATLLFNLAYFKVCSVPEDADFFSSAFTMMAGLTGGLIETPREWRFDFLRERRSTWLAAERHFIRSPQRVEIHGLTEISKYFESRTGEMLIIACSQFGFFPLTLASLTLVGFPIVGVYWELKDSYKEWLSNVDRLKLFDVKEVSNSRTLLRGLREYQAVGYVPVLLVDAPSLRGNTYDFLGYKVRCSKLIEVFRRNTDSAVVDIRGNVVSAWEMNLQLGAVQGEYFTTQQLLKSLEQSILNDPFNYCWTGGSIIFSDRRAFLNAIENLVSYLNWREKSCTDLAM